MSNTNDLSEQPPLERAIHRLREAQQLHEEDEYNFGREGVAIEQVDKTLDDIDEFITSEMTRLKENSLAHRGEHE